MPFTLTPTPSAGKGIPYTWFTDLLGWINGLNDQTWTSYTVTWTNGTIGNGILEGRYIQRGKKVTFRIDLIWGSTTSSSGPWAFSFPVAALATRSYSVATGEYVDTGTTNGPARGRLTSGSAFTVLSGATQLNTTSPHTWANTDELHLIGWFEAA